MKALIAAVRFGGSVTGKAARLYNDCDLLESLNWRWDFEQLGRQPAGKVAFLREYVKMRMPMVEERADGE